jgi:hypothetical protein
VPDIDAIDDLTCKAWVETGPKQSQRLPVVDPEPNGPVVLGSQLPGKTPADGGVAQIVHHGAEQIARNSHRVDVILFR